MVQHEWGSTLIQSWNEHHWYDQPARLGGKLAKLIGARPEDVIVADSTSLNVFKAAAAALRLRPGRRVIISGMQCQPVVEVFGSLRYWIWGSRTAAPAAERANFPTDLYMLQGLIDLIDNSHQLQLLDDVGELERSLTEDVALVVLTHVSYRTGRLLDMQAITRLVQSRFDCASLFKLR